MVLQQVSVGQGVGLAMFGGEDSEDWSGRAKVIVVHLGETHVQWECHLPRQSHCCLLGGRLRVCEEHSGYQRNQDSQKGATRRGMRTGLE